jgi:hypothetical protein
MSESSMDRNSGRASLAESAGFWTLFLTQTAALAVVCAYGLPLYRLFITAPGADAASGDRRLPLFCAAALMQICYWSRRRFLAMPPVRHDDLSGHILLFLARTLFVFAAAFVPIAFALYADAPPSPLGVVLVPVVLFAVFCYAWEVERLARVRLDPLAS